MFSRISEEWLNLIQPVEVQPIAEQIDQQKCCPSPGLWFNWARYIQPEQVKVVIIGMDPYSRKTDAHGLSFSSLSEKTPASLNNIFKCLVNTGVIPRKPVTNKLTNWVRQGVLLINAYLTVEENGKAGSHSELWKSYSSRLLGRISEYNPNIIYLLWGNNAQQLEEYIQYSKAVLHWRHPSPLAQMCPQADKFINCPHFIQVNRLLDEPINWFVWDYPRFVKPVQAKSVESVESAESEESVESVDISVFYTDGSCYPNKKVPKARAGYAVYCLSGEFKGLHILGSVSVREHFASNIRAEGKAILCVLKKLEGKKGKLYSDSGFWVDMVNKFMPHWSQKFFDDNLNPDLTKKIWYAYSQSDTELLFIPAAHNKKKNNWEQHDYYNNYVDCLANFARINFKAGYREEVTLN